jgi:hypothetical protein
VVDNSNIVRTIAGTRSLNGVGNNRLTAQFGTIGNLLYKSTATGAPTNLSTGLHIADAGSLTFSRINPATDLLELVAGNQLSRDPTAGSIFGETYLGQSVAGVSFVVSAFDHNGLFIWQSSSSMISRQTSSNTISNIGATGDDLARTSDGQNSWRVSDHGGGSGLIVDPQGRIYYGGYRKISGVYSSYPRIGYINPADNKYYRVIGADHPSTNTTNSSGDAVSSDGPVKTGGVFKSISCADPATTPSFHYKGQSSCYMQYDPRYLAGVGRLIFAERSKFRFVDRPYDSSSSTLGTMVDATRNIGAFVIKYVDPTDVNNENIDRIYYISGGALYCIKITGSSTSGCNNTSLGPVSGMPSLSSMSLTIDPSSGYLFMTSSNRQVVYRMLPPD